MQIPKEKEHKDKQLPAKHNAEKKNRATWIPLRPGVAEGKAVPVPLEAQNSVIQCYCILQIESCFEMVLSDQVWMFKV